MDTVIPDQLDHLIVTVPELAAGVEDLATATGVRAVPGGRHPGKGTANHLVGLRVPGRGPGTHTYLEILGPDPQQPTPADGVLPLDAHLARGLTLQTWAIHPPAFAARIAAANTAGIDVGEVIDMSRETTTGELLEWRLSSRSPLPGNGTQPFLIDWQDSTHPAEADLPSLELLEFSIETPDAEGIRRVLEVLGAGETTVNAGPEQRLHARLRGPDGELEF